ncbi:thiopurine S-methyltransferase, Se/Te detoxification family [Hoeflea sp. IMCC20628]|uniref:thiopurine S-methyltransferase n=1 Tax=Hoeflea sp. IMCC20628 TaxID=1620421 RepID=UPI00063A9EAB|nr:thiopurine S-methyltransferase [Hoeflea sp. IMCC20628]AKI00694.1 thiopurine S-methyltransferase, Se/Te detoxification family [Hoeflea sp. IMCC20628]
MEHSFWHDRWESGRIGFHEREPNPLLVTHFPALAVPENGRIFVPLCGKTLDIAWLLSQGHRVAGAELSELAIEQLFEDLGVEPAISDLGKLTHYSADSIDIFVGDIFDLTATVLGAVDAVFDRAALVALPEHMRMAYAPHIADITGNAPQLLITFEYDQSQLDGPPFSIPSDEVIQRYGDRYDISTLATDGVAGGFKGHDVRERVWLLRTL